MGKTLIVAEKPSVGRDIARVVGATQKSPGYIVGDQYVVTWAIGHLVTLSNPEELDEKYKKWTFDTLPIIPERITNKVVYRTRMQYNIVRKWMLSDEIDDLVCATDSGREGELIFRRIYEMTGCTKPFRRLWISSMTDEAISEGMAGLRPGTEYDNLYHSANCRAEADWLVGMNGSRGFSLTYDTLLSVGRVQSPTLAILVKRELERRQFVPEPYLELWATFRGYKGRWFDEQSQPVTHTIPMEKREAFEQLAAALKGQTATVEKVEHQQESIKPPLLYDLTQLQRDANRLLGWSAAKTLKVAQGLYEKRKVITYPRTDSNYLSNDLYKTLKTRLTRLKEGCESLVPFAETALQSERKLFGRVINDARVSDHHAIIPTGRSSDMKKLKDDEAALFDLVARRFIAVFLEDQVVDHVNIVTRALGHPFQTTGKNILQAGWSVVAPQPATKKRKSDEENGIPALSEGDERKISSAKLTEKKTQPPPPFTEAMLLAAMEHAGRYVEDEELADEMKDRGLGTPATRASIIERLIQVRYITRRGKTLVPTEKGILFVSILPEILASPETTGRWEHGLNAIGRGEMDPDQFMEQIKSMVQELVDYSKIKSDTVTFPEDVRRQGPSAEDREPLGKCPACQAGEILENSKAYYCSNWRRTRCSFTVWKNTFSRKEQGPEITVDMMKQLLQDGQMTVENQQLQMLQEPPWVIIPGLEEALEEELPAPKPRGRRKKQVAVSESDPAGS